MSSLFSLLITYTNAYLVVHFYTTQFLSVWSVRAQIWRNEKYAYEN